MGIGIYSARFSHDCASEGSRRHDVALIEPARVLVGTM